jgi:hypothetical protein
MQENNAENLEGNDLEPRSERALTECMTVLPNKGRAEGADGLFIVIGENDEHEQTYLADTRTNSCECKDDKYNLDDQEACKHVRRCLYEKGEENIPADVLGDIEIDAAFGAQVDASPTFVTADGGIINGDTGDILEDEAGTETENDTDGEDNSADVDIWGTPEPEINQYNRPTGHWVVSCEDCGITVCTGDTETATHRSECEYADRMEERID